MITVHNCCQSFILGRQVVIFLFFFFIYSCHHLNLRSRGDHTHRLFFFTSSHYSKDKCDISVSNTHFNFCCCKIILLFPLWIISCDLTYFKRYVLFHRGVLVCKCTYQFRMVLMYYHMHGGKNKIGWYGRVMKPTVILHM